MKDFPPPSASPCSACKLLRRRCSKDCIFAPHFPPSDPLRFASVHRVFGASNVSKMLQEIPEHRRSDAVSSMVYEANARVRDPVYGCVALIHTLRQEIASLQTQLAVVQAQMVYLMMQQGSNLTIPTPTPAPMEVPLSPSPAFDEVVEEFTAEDTLTIST